MNHFAAWEIVQNPINKRTVVKTDEGFIDPCDGLKQEARDFERAKLIAAAPELYAALEECSRVLSDLSSTAQTGTRTRAAFDKARAALAKVEV